MPFKLVARESMKACISPPPPSTLVLLLYGDSLSIRDSLTLWLPTDPSTYSSQSVPGDPSPPALACW